jgi:cysteine desulfurase
VTLSAVPRGIAPDTDALDTAITSDTAGCAIQWVNHETAVLLPVEHYAQACRKRGVPLLIDATQATGRLPIDVESLDADFIAIASHKIGGPAGAGALWVRRGRALEPQVRGGAQERGRRAGTPDVLSMVGFGSACAALADRLAAQPRCLLLRQRTERGLVELGFELNGSEGERTASAVSASLPGARGEELVAALDLEGVCVSSGAACSSGLSAPSPVLLAMHPEQPSRASSALRFSFGPETRESDIDFALDALRRVLARAALR